MDPNNNVSGSLQAAMAQIEAENKKDKGMCRLYGYSVRPALGIVNILATSCSLLNPFKYAGDPQSPSAADAFKPVTAIAALHFV